MPPLLPFAFVISLLAAPFGPAAAQTAGIGLELNKLSPVDGGCRAFFVVQNDGDTAFDSLDLDLVTFRPDGVVGSRFQVELAPLAADKTVVKPFDFADVACEDIDRLLVNGVVACAPPEPATCLGLIEPTSLAAELFK